jgi:alpha-amylase
MKLKYFLKKIILGAGVFFSLNAMAQTSSQTTGMERGKVFYEIFIRSFYDSNGDGVGDINGITKKLDYLKELGVDGIWITPVHPSPSYHKYDVLDYYQIDKEYGTLDDYKKLIAEAHKRNIKVLLDLVVNHTSSSNPWFLAALNNDPKYKNYYVWANADTLKDKTGWRPVRNASAPLHKGELYYALFSPGMPDLNYDNPAVRAEIIKIGRYWVKDIGVDGFRLDAAQHIYPEDEIAKNVQWWSEFRDSVKTAKPDFWMVGECWGIYPRVVPYLAALNATFDFDLSFSIINSAKKGEDDSLLEKVITIQKAATIVNPDFDDATILTNHDNNRIASDLDGDLNKARVAASLLFSFPGTPFIYYGEEIGMLGEKPDEDIREPFLWADSGKDAGQTKWEKPQFSTYKNVVPLSRQINDKNSIYNFYKNWIAFRKNSEVLQKGDIEATDIQQDGILIFYRNYNGKKILVIHNLSAITKVVATTSQTIAFRNILFSTNSQAKAEHSGWTLPAYSSVVLSAAK